MARLRPEEEERLAHSYHNYSIIGFLGLSVSLILLLFTAYSHLHYSVGLTTFSFGWVFEFAFNAGRVRPVTIDEVNHKYNDEEVEGIRKNRWVMESYTPFMKDPEAFRKQNPGSFPQWNVSTPFRREWYAVDFGATHYSACRYNDGGRPLGLPSILRTLELSCAAQIAVRLLVLSSFYIRWYYTFLRCTTVKNTQRGVVIRTLAFVTPKVQLVAMTLEFLITCLQQNLDGSLKWLMPHVVIGWAVSVCTYMLVFTLMSMIGGGSESSSRLAQIRLGCLTICVACSPVWIENHLKFLKLKTCFTEVPAREAMAEYVTVFAVIVFVATQLYEMRNYWGLLSCSVGDYYVKVNAEFEGRYRPAENIATYRNCIVKMSSSSRDSSDSFDTSSERCCANSLCSSASTRCLAKSQV